MKKVIALSTIIAGVIVAAVLIFGGAGIISEDTAAAKAPAQYKFPDFYRGFYVTSATGTNKEKLANFIDKAKKANLNAIVIDVQTASLKHAAPPKENIDLCIANGVHPIARVVMFPDGLKQYPIADTLLENRLYAAESAAIAGFKEIQLDYIRFSDSAHLKHIPVKQRYEIVIGVVKKVKERLAKYNVKIAVDIFGRIPLNTDDLIGQKMEVFDQVVDIICPMSYPSHYTWSAKMMADPYFTVYTTAVKAKERAKKAEIVSWIQAFQMKVKKSGLTYDKYVEEQIRAVHDSKTKGYIMWNAAQEYTVPMLACERYYSTPSEKVVSVK